MCRRHPRVFTTIRRRLPHSSRKKKTVALWLHFQDELCKKFCQIEKHQNLASGIKDIQIVDIIVLNSHKESYFVEDSVALGLH